MHAIIEILFEALRLMTFQPARKAPHPDVTASEDCWSAQLRTQTDVPATRS